MLRLLKMKIPDVVCICCMLFCYFHHCTASPWDQFLKNPTYKASWPTHGGPGTQNRRQAIFETKITRHTVSKLKLKWQFDSQGEISVTPSIVDGTVYFPNWSGYVYALDAATGNRVWKTNLTLITNSNTTISARSAVVAGDLVLAGVYGPATLVALDRATGNLRWSVLLDTHPYAIITMSGTATNGAYYVGVSSSEENASPQTCCTFQGSFVKVALDTGTVVWRTSMLPSNGGKRGLYAGASLWGSSPSIDCERNAVYIATGNTYSVPRAINTCQEEQNNKTVPDYPDPCIQPDDHSESILALDLDNGTIIWANHLGSFDTWVGACIFDPPNCPPIAGPDADFGEAPMLLRIWQGHANSSEGGEGDDRHYWRDVAIVGQKNGIMHALDRDTGAALWNSVAGPGGVEGGITWGSATDGTRVYTSMVNSNHENFTLIPTTTVITGSGWVALNARNGSVLWSVPVPHGAVGYGPVSVVNGVVFVTSSGSGGNGAVYGLDGASGKILWAYEKTDGSISGGVSIVDGCVYVGSGSGRFTHIGFPFFTKGTTLYAFCVPELI